MAEKDPPLTWDEIDRYMHEMSHHIIGRLPDNTERRRAEQLVDQAYDYVKQSREKRPDR